ncbi:MAG TPA: RNA methyltransferase [Streptosporangiaceae bacterium]|jgi:TrmH family RNA methyltransferase|nr:RNA methyltransferase [Streptosporangiaceae bacterium]
MTDGRGPRAGLEITSPANARIKHVVALRRRRARELAGVTLVEGYAEVDLALSAEVRPRELYYCPELGHGDPLGVLDRVTERGGEVITVSRAAFGKIAYRESPDGWLAVVPTVDTRLDRLDLGEQPLLLICEGVEKPGNLGAILRTADAAGVTAVIATDPVTDWGNANLVRASKGAVFSVPVAAAPSAQALPWLAERGVRVAAATPDGDVLLGDADLTGPVAIAVGSETHGLSGPWLGQADVTLRIPMFGRADSLNVAASAAIVVYEAVRQRMAHQRTP